MRLLGTDRVHARMRASGLQERIDPRPLPDRAGFANGIGTADCGAAGLRPARRGQGSHVAVARGNRAVTSSIFLLLGNEVRSQPRARALVLRARFQAQRGSVRALRFAALNARARGASLDAFRGGIGWMNVDLTYRD